MVFTINPGYLLCKIKLYLPCNRWSDVHCPLSINLRCYQNIYVEILQNKLHKTGNRKKSINIDQSKVNDILKIFSKSTQIYDELLDENKQPLTVASKQYTVVINILIKPPIFF